jgi:hypothetical protein
MSCSTARIVSFTPPFRLFTISIRQQWLKLLNMSDEMIPGLTKTMQNRFSFREPRRASSVRSISVLGGGTQWPLLPQQLRSLPFS